MTRKDHRLVADATRRTELERCCCQQEVVGNVARLPNADDSSFNRQRFQAACGSD